MISSLSKERVRTCGEKKKKGGGGGGKETVTSLLRKNFLTARVSRQFIPPFYRYVTP